MQEKLTPDETRLGGISRVLNMIDARIGTSYEQGISHGF